MGTHYEFLIYNVVFCGRSDLISGKHTHTQKHTEHIQGVGNKCNRVKGHEKTYVNYVIKN